MRLVLGLVLCATAFGQTDATEAVATSRTPTAEELQKRLQTVKDELLPRVWSAKVAQAPLEQKKYLAQWQTVTSAHYLLFTNGPTATCKKYATTLEELYAMVQKELPFADLDHLLTCYIFATPEEYYRFCGVAAGWSEAQARATAGHATAAYYACYYASPRDPVVFHEATHQIVGACHKVHGVGSWFQEGLAEYFEKKASGEKPAGVIKNDIKRGDYYPLPEFVAIDSLIADQHSRRNYAHSGALIDFLINTKLPPVAGKFAAFLTAARTSRAFGRDAETSARLVRSVYGLSLEGLEALWKAHLGFR